MPIRSTSTARPEFVYTLHEGQARRRRRRPHLTAANRSAVIQLGKSVRELKGQRLDEIFQTTLDDMLQRSHRGAYRPIVVYRASAAHRFFAVARPPAHEVDAALVARVRPGRSASALTGGAQAIGRRRPGWYSGAAGAPAASLPRGADLRRSAPAHPPGHRAPGVPSRAARRCCCAPRPEHPERARIFARAVHAETARRRPLHRRDQLREPARDADRGRALRLSRRRLHRRGEGRPARQDRASRMAARCSLTTRISDMPLALQRRGYCHGCSTTAWSRRWAPTRPSRSTSS